MNQNPAAVSYWLETAGGLAPRPPLSGTTTVDVAVLGAGFTGLWTAWYLLGLDPSLRVAVVEQEVAGFGASGRNGAWCSAGLGVSPGVLARRHGAQAARAMTLALRQTVDEIGEVARRQGLSVDFWKGGILRVARGRHELAALSAGLATRQALGLAEDLERLDATETEARVRVADAQGALFDPHGATLHPGKLVRGLARLVEGRGGRLYEGTRVLEVVPRANGRPARLLTLDGEVRAGTVVLAGEAYLTALPGLRRRLLPLYSLIVLTEALSAAQWSALGWEGRESLSSHRYTVDYLSRTADGRVLFGGRGAPYHYGSQIAPAFDRDADTHALLRSQLLDWFPALRGVRFSHAWGGAVGMPRDWMPTVNHDPRTGLAGAYGYTGQGVATANLAGRILADLITGRPSPLTQLPIVGHRSRAWEPEPLRWLAVRTLQRRLAAIDQRARQTGTAPTARSLAERLSAH